MSIRKSYVAIASLLLGSGLLAGCGGGSSSSSTGSVAAGTVNLTGFSVSSVSGLTYSAATSTVSTSNASLMWMNSGYTSAAAATYTNNGTAQTLTLSVMASLSVSGTYLMSSGGFTSCLISGTMSGMPTCSSLGVNFSHTGGTLTFTNTPAIDSTGKTGTMTGSLTFTAF